MQSVCGSQLPGTIVSHMACPTTRTASPLSCVRAPGAGWIASLLQTVDGRVVELAIKRKYPTVQVIVRMLKTRSQNRGGSPHPSKAG